MGNWWEERSALLNEAVAMIASQADCSLDAALQLLELRARALDRDLEDTARAVIDRRTRFAPEFLTYFVIEGDARTRR